MNAAEIDQLTKAGESAQQATEDLARLVRLEEARAAAEPWIADGFGNRDDWHQWLLLDGARRLALANRERQMAHREREVRDGSGQASDVFLRARHTRGIRRRVRELHRFVHVLAHKLAPSSLAGRLSVGGSSAPGSASRAEDSGRGGRS